MALLLPDGGLLFWTLISFGIVFFLLAKFGFPVITKSVEKRREFVQSSLEGAKEAQIKLLNLKQEGDALIESANNEQGKILREAAAERDKIIKVAKEQASIIAKKEFDDAKLQIAKERDEAILNIRREVAMLSCDIAEKILREKLSDKQTQMEFIEKMLGEMSRQNKLSN